jgi:hypothetical protein
MYIHGDDKDVEEYARNLSIGFANWVDQECFKNILGYMIHEDDSGLEYQLDELFDYWIEMMRQKHSH